MIKFFITPNINSCLLRFPPKNARIFTNPDHYLSLLLLHNILR
ncbi:MAG: hypothetical protein BECKG1743F_GA0114225_111651, partial [Candidatus Kentron sp. G]